MISGFMHYLINSNMKGWRFQEPKEGYGYDLTDEELDIEFNN